LANEQTGNLFALANEQTGNLFALANEQTGNLFALALARVRNDQHFQNVAAISRQTAAMG
jgi:hypothetical protein